MHKEAFAALNYEYSELICFICLVKYRVFINSPPAMTAMKSDRTPLRALRCWSYIFLFLISIPLIRAQEKPDLASLDFKSPFEEKVFSNLEEAQDLDLLMAISDGMTEAKVKAITTYISDFKKALEKKKFGSKNEEKKLKILFDLTHDRFFDQYIEVSNFYEIFRTREYNCVSATALYALILKSYGIPYQIKETPTHVYAVAYPYTKNILLESTAPQSGYFSPSQKDIERAVEALVESKYIKQSEVDRQGITQVYNNFFYSKDNIDIRQLAGLQYYNETLQHLEKEQYKAALNAVRKSALLYPSEKIDFLESSIMVSIFAESDFDSLDDIRLLADFANLNGDSESMVTETYKIILNNNLLVKDNGTFVDSVYQTLTEKLKDAEIKKTISENHFIAYGEYHLRKSQTTKALEKLKKAYELNSKNVGTQSMITDCLVQKFARGGSTRTISSMNEYEAEFTFLTENSLYQSIKFYNYSFLGYMQFREDNREKGLEYLGLMDELRDKFGEDLKIDDARYGMIYAEAGAHYYRKKEYQKAKEIIEKGLERVPDHTELIARLEIVMDALK